MDNYQFNETQQNVMRFPYQRPVLNHRPPNHLQPFGSNTPPPWRFPLQHNYSTSFSQPPPNFMPTKPWATGQQCFPNQPFNLRNPMLPFSNTLSLIHKEIPPYIHRQERFFNRPPPAFFNNRCSTLPSPLAQPTSAANSVRIEDFPQRTYKAIMKERVEDWLQKRAMQKQSNKTNTHKKTLLKIFEYKELISEYMQTVEILHQLNDNLSDSIGGDEKVWQELISDSTYVKKKLFLMQKALFNEEQVSFIASKLKERKRKRERLRRQKERNLAEYRVSLSNRIKLNEQIDDAIHKQHLEISTQKMVENLKNEAGESLIEVKRKQVEADEQMAVFQKIKQLRDLRKKTAIYKGILVTEKESVMFDLKVNQAMEIMKKQLEIYHNEEKALRVLREEETEEFNRVESAKQKRKKEKRRTNHNTVDPIFSYRMYWMQAHDSIPALINVSWCEQDPSEILSLVLECVDHVMEDCKLHGISISDVKAIGITNQRESTVVWDSTTGKHLYPAIIWLDARTKDTVQQLVNKTSDQSKTAFQHVCGLPLSTYFSGVKLRWIFDHCDGARQALHDGRCFFGTIDSWLLWNLTGGVDGGIHATDVTNASRTMLMNISTLKWDDEMCKFFEIPQSILPEIRSSSEIYGYMKHGQLSGVPISGILGDQQAALVGHKCFTKGQAKNTYGTGNFLLYNTGQTPVFSEHGLLTTVAYKFDEEPAVYALEGSIAITGAAIQWLRDNMGLIKDAKETEALAASVSDNGDVYFVPAFSGLFAPYWNTSARGLIVGLTQYTTKAHVVRAALEAVCYQTKEIMEAMYKDSNIEFQQLLVDGGMTVNNFLMQLQADLLGIDVVKAVMPETTALGAAIAAGRAKGIDCWKANMNEDNRVERFTSKLAAKSRDQLYTKWKDAVSRTLSWTS